jgi:uncharacterized protein with HEPN domain
MVYMGHMLDMARKAVRKARDVSRSRYDADEDIRIILAHLVQSIGEAAAHVSQETRRLHAGIPWKQVIGIRHRIVHDYMDVDYDVVWEVVTRDLPDLIGALESFVRPQDP